MLYKYFLGVAIVFISTFGLSAQKGFHFGVHAGYGASFIVNQNNFETLFGCQTCDPRSELDYEATYGYTLGASAGINFQRTVGLQLGVLFNKAGQDYKDSFSRGTYDVERFVDLSYLQIPVQLRYTSDRGDVARFYALFGPQIGILLNSEEEVIINGDPKPEDDYLVRAEDKFATFDLGIALDFGVDIFMTDNLFLNAGISIYYGLTDVNGKELKEIEWFSKNDVEYAKSNNFRAGLNIGVHYLIKTGRGY